MTPDLVQPTLQENSIQLCKLMIMMMRMMMMIVRMMMMMTLDLVQFPLENRTLPTAPTFAILITGGIFRKANFI